MDGTTASLHSPAGMASPMDNMLRNKLPTIRRDRNPEFEDFLWEGREGSGLEDGGPGGTLQKCS
jgi:hypothetical protein